MAEDLTRKEKIIVIASVVFACAVLLLNLKVIAGTLQQLVNNLIN